METCQCVSAATSTWNVSMTRMRDSRLARTPVRDLPRVEVEWVDAASCHPWQSLADARKDGLVRCWTIGYLVRNTRDIVSLCQARGDNARLGENWSIPRTCVLRIRRLKLV